MKQEISNVMLTEDSQVSRRALLTRFSQRVGLFLTAALLMITLSAFTSTSSAHASGGGCWSYNTWSHGATSQDNGTPSMYGNDAHSPNLGLGLNSCQQYIMIKWNDRGYDYYKIDWTRPGENG